jgi:hypothetical protein
MRLCYIFQGYVSVIADKESLNNVQSVNEVWEFNGMENIGYVILETSKLKKY